MKNKFQNIVLMLLVLTVGSGLYYIGTGGAAEDVHKSHGKQADHEEHGEEEEHDDHDDHEEHGEHEEHGGHDDHGHGNDLEMSVEEIMSTKCEHGKKAVDCNNCRFEVGVVQLDPSLLQTENQKGLVKVERAGKRFMSHTTVTTGEVQMNENMTVHIRSRLTGLVHKSHVDIGEYVKKGQSLITIDSIELGETVADLQKAHASMKLAESVYERENKLYLKKVSSEREMLETKTDFEKAKIEVESHKRKLRLYGLSEKHINNLLQNGVSQAGLFTIHAPQGGMVIHKHAVHGELVTPENELFIITDVTSLWVWADIYERDLSALVMAQNKEHIKARVTVDAFPLQSFQGNVDYVGFMADEATRTVKVRINIDNRKLLLRPGMFCHISIATGEGKQTLAVPVSAVLTDDGKKFVFRRLKDNYFFRRLVTTGLQSDSWVEITDGINFNDEIISMGAFLLKSDVLRSKMGAGCAD